MDDFKLSREEYDAFEKIFLEKTKKLEEQYKNQLALDEVELPLVSNFVWG